MESVREVKEVVFNHFRLYYSSCSHPRLDMPPELFIHRISHCDIAFLESSFSVDEVRNVVWSCGSNKSPDPNGFNFVFFKENWEMLKDEIMVMMNEFHCHGKIVRGMNSSFIVLIPKKENNSRLEDF